MPGYHWIQSILHLRSPAFLKCRHKAEQIYFFQHLKMSDAKADEWNKLADKNAPAVLKNEPAQKAQTTTGCPNCNAEVTLAQLQQIFTKANADDLKAIAANYTKYMAELNMNTCWNKAHFFAQVKGESGDTLNITEDENFNYWYKRLNRFKAFRTAEGKIKAKELGRQTEENNTGHFCQFVIIFSQVFIHHKVVDLLIFCVAE